MSGMPRRTGCRKPTDAIGRHGLTAAPFKPMPLRCIAIGHIPSNSNSGITLDPAPRCGHPWPLIAWPWRPHALRALQPFNITWVMQTAAPSRCVRNNIVARSRRRHAPRQRVASHNRCACWRAAALTRRGALRPPPASRVRAHIHVRVASFVSCAVARGSSCVPSVSASPRACTRAAHAYTAACALRAHAGACEAGG